MAEVHTRVPHVPVRRWLLAIVGIVGLIGFRRAFHRRDHRPSADRLLKMTEADFVSFIRASGIGTVTTSGLGPPLEGTAD